MAIDIWGMSEITIIFLDRTTITDVYQPIAIENTDKTTMIFQLLLLFGVTGCYRHWLSWLSSSLLFLLSYLLSLSPLVDVNQFKCFSSSRVLSLVSATHC